MKDWKTTLTGLVGGLALIAVAFGLEVSQEVQTSLVAVVLFILGFFSKQTD